MYMLRGRARRALHALSLGLLLVPALIVACRDDGPNTGQEQVAPSQQTEPAQAQGEQQTQPIDAAQQGAPDQQQPRVTAQSQPEQPADQEQTTLQQTEPVTQPVPPSDETQSGIQQDQQQQSVNDPDRDTLNEGEPFASSIGPEQTERLFRFQAATGAWLRITVDGTGGMDPIVTLLDPEGVEISANDDRSATNRDSLLIAQVPSEGLQLIRVQPFDSNSRGDFVIQVTTLSIGVDDDNAIISVGDHADGRLNSPTDIDVFEFQVEAGQQVFVQVDGDTGVDVFTQLFAPDGNLIQIDDDGGHGLDAEIYFTADTAGLWRVEVWPASNKDGQRQLIGSYRITAHAGLPTSAVGDSVAADLAAAALTFLQALRDGDALTIIALAGPEALTIWGWNDDADVRRDIRKIQSIDLGDEILQAVSFGDVLQPARGRVYFQFSEDDWMRFELIQLDGRWLVDDWAHSIGPPS